MACDLPTTKAAACESGIGKLDSPIALLQIIAQLSCEIADAGGGGGGTPGGADTQVQYNDGGVFGGDAAFTFNDVTKAVTHSGDILFSPDNIHSIGAAGANRPLSIHASGAINAGGQINSFSGFRSASNGGFNMPADGVMFLLNNAATGFDRMLFGGTTNTFPALQRSTTMIRVRLADDSAYAPLEADTLRTSVGYQVGVDLPAAGVAGRRAYVTNALAPAFMAVVAGGGAVVTPVFDDGTNWICA